MIRKKPQSVLVTGGAGYIGSHTCKALAAAGYNPVTLDNLTLGHRWAVQWGPLVEADLLDADAVQSALRDYGIEAIIHFAASAYVGDSMRDPAAYYRNNVLTTMALSAAMRSANVLDIVFSSSCSVDGNPIRVPIDETQPPGPLSPYGQSKFDGENALRWYGQAYGIRWMALRYFNAAGADDAEGDLARAHVSALNALDSGIASQVLNLGTGRGYSVRDLLMAVATTLGREIPHKIAPRHEVDPAVVIADAPRAAAVLGWSARESALETIVATAAHWHAKHNHSAHSG